MTRNMIFNALIGACAMIAALPAAAGAPVERDPLAPRPDVSNLPSAEAPIVITALLPRGTPDVMGTVALRAGVTIYDARFRRVAAVRSASLAPIVASLAGLSPEAQLARVKSEVANSVRLTNDLEAMGVADYWDNASDTLTRGNGDGEDIAIVEMQALKAAGFNPRDLYVSVGRHRGIGAHAVLLARTPSGFFMLDATERAPIPASFAGGGRFVPMITVGTDGSWVHGRRVAAAR